MEIKAENHVYFTTAWDPTYDISKYGYETESTNPGLVLLSTILEENGFKARVMDVNYIIQNSPSGFFASFRDQVKHIAKEICSFPQNSLIGFSSIAVGFHYTIAVIREVKKNRKDLKIFLGGPHVAGNTKKILEFEQNVDAIIVGESEEAIVPFCEYLSNHNINDELDFPENIPNIWYRKNNGIHHTVLRNQDVDIKTLPIPDYSLVLPSNRRIPKVFFVEGGRGCPYRCVYCSTSAYWRKMYQEPLIDKTVLEIEDILKNYGEDTFIQISNDLFLSSESRTKEVVQKFSKSKYPFNWGCYSRIDTLELEQLKDLEKTGLKTIYFGIETGSEVVQKKIKKNLNINQVIDTLRFIKRNTDIKAQLCFMYGFYFESLEAYLDTLRLLSFCKIEGLGKVGFSELRLMPGTEIFEERKEFLKVNTKFMGFNRENLAYRMSKSYMEELLSAEKELFPLLYQDSYILDNSNYNLVRIYCEFISYLEKKSYEYRFYESKTRFNEFYSCLYEFFVGKDKLNSNNCTRGQCDELFEIMVSKKII